MHQRDDFPARPRLSSILAIPFEPAEGLGREELHVAIQRAVEETYPELAAALGVEDPPFEFDGTALRVELPGLEADDDRAAAFAGHLMEALAQLRSLAADRWL